MKKKAKLTTYALPRSLKKYFLIMKLTTLLCLLYLLPISASVYSQNNTLSLDIQNKTVKEVFEQLEQQSQFRFFYNDNFTDLNKVVSLNVNQSKIEDILNELLGSSTVTFRILSDNLIVIAPKVSIQQMKVTGTVKDASTSEPLIGVNVVVEGTTVGTTTDGSGNYSIDVPNKNVSLIFTYIGYVTEKVSLAGQNNLDVTLAPDIKALDEIVVVGYGTVKKSDVTGSVSSVNADKIKAVPVNDFRQALQGRAAGVDVNYGSRRPGDGASVLIRGRRSFQASNDPLYVIDGIPTSNAQLGDINPTDIESMEILKDASATAIYGSRAANGVVLIQTKRGKSGKTTVTYDGYYGISQIAKKMDFEDGAGYAEQKREAYRNNTKNYYKSSYADPYYDYFDANGIFKQDPVLWESVSQGYEWTDDAKTIVKRDANGIPIYHPDKVRSTDWASLVTRQGSTQNHNLSISGGNEKTKVLFAATSYSEQGVIKGQDFQRYNIRLNLDHEVTKWFKIGASTNYSYSNQNYGSNLYNSATTMLPLALPYDKDGNVVFKPGNDALIFTPLNDIDGMLNERTKGRFFSAIYTEIKPFRDLTYRMNFGPDFGQYRNGEFRSAMSSDRQGSSPYARYYQDQRWNYVLENILTYTKTFAQKHDLALTLMQSIQNERFESSEITAYNLPYEDQKWYNIGTAGTINSIASNLWTQKMASFMGRINYSYNNKYLITLTGRQDGASMLAEGHKYDFFPAVALAWKIGKEDFMKNINVLSDLKLRGGYGVTGNSSISAYQTQGDLARTKYDWNGSTGYGYRPNTIPNPNLKWETTASSNMALDFGILDNRITGTIDAYRSNTSDLLMQMQLPTESGFGIMLANVGKTRNTGLEIQLSATIINTASGFKWSTDLMWYKNKEEITELYGGKKDDPGNKWFIGQPIRTFYDYKLQGIWQDTHQDSTMMKAFNAKGAKFAAGKIRVVDTNGDTTINANDRQILGSDVPKWTGSWGNTFSYKGVELSFFIYTKQGQMLNAQVLSDRMTLFGRYENLNVHYWAPTDPDRANATHPRPNADQEFPDYRDVYRYVDGSFTKLRNVTLAYNFPQSIVSKLKMQNLRIYVTAQNPITWTNFKGLDPEYVTNSTTGETGVDTPSTKVYMFGVNVTF
jgi:TonB-linked SusC/RagA family outer membrane protein